jgi:hypothetical protein
MQCNGAQHRAKKEQNSPLVRHWVMTTIGLEVPLIDAVTVSVAVMVWYPVVRSVAENTPIPFVSFEFPGSTACASVLEKCTVPA